MTIKQFREHCEKRETPGRKLFTFCENGFNLRHVIAITMAAAVQMNTAVGVKCNALTFKGENCKHNASMDGMCKIHINARSAAGPNTYELTQLDYKYKKLKAHRKTALDAEISPLLELYPVASERARAYTAAHSKYRSDIDIIKGDYAREKQAIKQKHADEIARTGVNPDAAAEGRKEARRQRIKEIRDRRLAQRRAAIQFEEAQNILNFREAIVLGVGGMGQRGILDGVFELYDDHGPHERQLADIAADPQGVHTTEVVEHIKTIVEKVRTVPVPDEYRWNKDVCSLTPAEIIMQCRLSQKAAWQMMSQYAQDTAIYDIEEGIYGKVLDSVWQFIKTHAEKESLIAILRSEMEDNIGMCAQGNLTRICNILSGYMDGVGVAESLAEKLGRLLPPLREIESRDVRHVRVLDILEENAVPADQWDTWIDAVMAE